MSHKLCIETFLLPFRLRIVNDIAVSQTVMIVADDEASNDEISRVLQALGLTVRSYTDANAARDAIRKPGLRFDLLLTDGRFPPGQAQGLVLASHARHWHPAAAVVLFTRDPEIRRSALQSGLTVLSKPISLMALTSAVRVALRLE